MVRDEKKEWGGRSPLPRVGGNAAFYHGAVISNCQ